MQEHITQLVLKYSYNYKYTENVFFLSIRIERASISTLAFLFVMFVDFSIPLKLKSVTGKVSAVRSDAIMLQ